MNRPSLKHGANAEKKQDINAWHGCHCDYLFQFNSLIFMSFPTIYSSLNCKKLQKFKPNLHTDDILM